MTQDRLLSAAREARTTLQEIHAGTRVSIERIFDVTRELHQAVCAQETVSEESVALAEKARVEERQRCLDLAMEQYRYWRDCDAKGDRSEVLTDISIGAMGAAANIVAGILDMMTRRDPR